VTFQLPSETFVYTAVMAFQCPACNTPIRLGPLEDAPKAGAIYRCAVCKIDLRLDPTKTKFEVPPIHLAADDTPRSRRRG